MTTAAATITRARNSEESGIQLAALEELSKLGIPVFIADAGSIPSFLKAVESLPGVQVRVEGENLVQQVKASVARAVAAGHRFILYTEPDKKEFFQRSARNFVAEALRAEAAVCIAARNAESFATFPAGQQWTEAAFNGLASSFLGSLPDQLYGPLVLDAQALGKFVEAAPEGLGWGWRPYVVARAVRSGLRVATYTGAFFCPVEQREEDDHSARLYRLQQLGQNIEGLRVALQDSLYCAV